MIINTINCTIITVVVIIASIVVVVVVYVIIISITTILLIINLHTSSECFFYNNVPFNVRLSRHIRVMMQTTVS